MLIVYLGERIDEHGIGNGISLLLFAGIVSRFPQMVMDVISGFRAWLAVRGGTAGLIEKAGLPVERVKKVFEGRPNLLDEIANGKIDLIVNTPAGKESLHDDSYIRKGAIKGHIPYMTTMAAAKATAAGILEVKQHPNKELRSLQNIHAAIER